MHVLSSEKGCAFSVFGSCACFSRILTPSIIKKCFLLVHMGCMGTAFSMGCMGTAFSTGLHGDGFFNGLNGDSFFNGLNGGLLSRLG